MQLSIEAMAHPAVPTTNVVVFFAEQPGISLEPRLGWGKVSCRRDPTRSFPALAYSGASLAD